MFPLFSQLWPTDRRIRALQQLYLLQTFVAVLGRVVAYSWLLGARSSDGLPLIYVLQSLPLCLLAFGMTGWVDRLGRASLMRWTALGFAAISLLFWAAAGLSIDWMASAYLLFVETAIALLTMQFWLLTSDLVSPEQARQHFPSFSVYGALGAILTGALVRIVDQRAPTELLLLMPLPLLLMAAATWWLGSRYHYRLKPKGGTSIGADWRTQLRGMTALLQESSLLRHVAALSALITCSGLLIDFIYCITAESGAESANLPLFFSNIQVVTNVAQLVLVLAFGRHIFTALGLIKTLASFPVGAFVLILAGTLSGPSLAGVGLKIFDRLENYLILNPGISIVQSTFPRDHRGRSSLFYSGILKPVVVAMTGLALLQFRGDRQQLFMVLAGVLVLFVPVLLGLTRAYRQALVENLTSSERMLVANSIEALGEPENSSVVPDLLAFSARHTDPALRENVLLTAGRIGDRRFIPVLLDALQDPNISLKVAAVRALSRFLGQRRSQAESGEVRDALLRALKETDSARVKACILSALTEEAGSAQLVPLLVTALGDADERVQANAIEALGLMKDRALLLQLVPYLESDSPRIWANAVIAVSRLPELRPRLLLALEARLGADSALWRSSALFAAGELHFPSLLGKVTEATHATDPDVQRNAWIALGKQGDLSAVGPLVDLLTGAPTQARLTARALDRLAHPVREAVVAALCMAPSRARAGALEALRTCDVNLLEELERLTAVSGGYAASLFLRAAENLQSEVVRQEEPLENTLAAPHGSPVAPVSLEERP